MFYRLHTYFQVRVGLFKLFLKYRICLFKFCYLINYVVPKRLCQVNYRAIMSGGVKRPHVPESSVDFERAPTSIPFPRTRLSFDLEDRI